MTRVIALQRAYPDIKALEDLEQAISRPYKSEKIGEYGYWEKLCDSVKDYIEHYMDEDDAQKYTYDILLTALYREDAHIANDGSIWVKKSALLGEVCSEPNDEDYPDGDIRKYIFKYEDVGSANMYVTYDYHVYFEGDEEEYEFCEEEPWPFKDDTPVYVLTDI